MNPYIITRYGHKIHFMRPDPKEIDIRDICHSLSHIVRFNGHTKEAYHVAQHVCLAADNAPEDIRREAFAHDWCESMVSDMPSPLKSLLPQFSAFEAILEKIVAKKYGFRFPYPPGVKEIDMRMLVTEIRDLTNRKDWKDYPFSPFPEKIKPWSSETCRREFMKRYRKLFD